MKKLGTFFEKIYFIANIQSLRVKMPLIISAIVSVMIVILLIIIVDISQKNIKETSLSGFNIGLNGYASFIDSFLDSQSTLLKTYSSSDDILSFYNDRTEENRNIALRFLKKARDYNEYVLDVSITDLDGTLLANALGGDITGINITKQFPDILEMIEDNDFIFSKQPKQSIVTGDWIYPVFSVIKNDDGEKIGIMYMMLEWSALNKNYISGIEVGESGRILFLNEDGKIIIHKNLDIIGKDTDIYKIIQANIDSPNILYSYETIVGTKAEMVFQDLDKVPWYIVLAIDSSELYSTINTFIKISIIATIIIIIILMVFISLFAMTITKPLALVSEQLNKLAHGDLSWEISNSILQRKDEFGLISKAQIDILEHLGSIIQLVVQSSNQIASAASQVAAGNSDLASRTEMQAASVEETASSMEEMASTITSSAENAIECNGMMNESKIAIKEAGGVIVATTLNIEEVYESSEKISAITKIIENIAFQTNILALNAAVEAARAGEQGRGFAVVASEVRNLAQTTQSSVKEITDLIASSNEKIKKATDTARESQTIFIDIEKKIEATADIMDQIGTASREQQEAVTQVNKAVTEIDTTTQHNAALVEESTAASESLLSQARELNEAMKFFKLK